LERCTEIAKGLDSENVDFIGPFLERQTLGILSMADVLVLPTQGDQSLVSMPSKLIAYMMAARPILSVACPESDLANVISTSGCGWVAKPNDAKGLAELLRKIRYLDRAELERMGKAGREYALAHFSTEACLPKLIEVIENAGTHNRIFSDQNTESERIRT
jgi:glycosyltransferase involved in cell wall biosynthesis